MVVEDIFDLYDPREVDAVIPTYDKNGANISYLILSDGEKVFVDCSVREFLTEWLACFKLTLHGCHTWAKFTNKQSKLNPILVNKDIIMLPVKTRKSVSTNDGSYAYVKHSSVVDTSQKKIIFTSGASINYISKCLTVDNKMKDALLLQYIHIDETKNLLSN